MSEDEARRFYRATSESAKAGPKATPSNPKTINKTKVAEVKEKPEEKKEPVAAAVKQLHHVWLKHRNSNRHVYMSRHVAI